MGDESSPSPVKDRHVLLAAVAAAGLVLGLLLLSAWVRPLGDALAGAPVLISALVLVTLVVLVRAVRGRAP